ncbi:MAG: methyltransferase domain-containing protein [Rhodospirillales bacterium]|nr:methyltransferase domain-containing protein [Rhodospirillales bacterium]
MTKDKHDIQAFWGSLYDSLYGDADQDITREQLLEALGALEDMFRLRGHLAVVEMPLGDLAGKRVLEIGPGAGGHSALFARHGALVTAVDITSARARATAKKFATLGAEGCSAMQGDAEFLPFDAATFDIVYSNGVLHHTNDTEAAIDEVFRVLRPGGRAVIMLYCKSSWHYWINMWLCVGVLKGALLSGKNWLGRATEWGGKNTQTVENPITRCYTAGGIRTLFGRFENLTLRKGDFYFYLIPKLGRLYRRWQIKHYGTHPGGYLVYGEPWPIQSPLEYWLGGVMGFSWFISATKADENAQ